MSTILNWPGPIKTRTDFFIGESEQGMGEKIEEMVELINSQSNLITTQQQEINNLNAKVEELEQSGGGTSTITYKSKQLTEGTDGRLTTSMITQVNTGMGCWCVGENYFYVFNNFNLIVYNKETKESIANIPFNVNGANTVLNQCAITIYDIYNNGDVISVNLWGVTQQGVLVNCIFNSEEEIIASSSNTFFFQQLRSVDGIVSDGKFLHIISEGTYLNNVEQNNPITFMPHELMGFPISGDFTGLEQGGKNYLKLRLLSSTGQEKSYLINKNNYTVIGNVAELESGDYFSDLIYFNNMFIGMNGPTSELVASTYYGSSDLDTERSFQSIILSSSGNFSEQIILTATDNYLFICDVMTGRIYVYDKDLREYYVNGSETMSVAEDDNGVYILMQSELGYCEKVEVTREVNDVLIELLNK